MGTHRLARASGRTMKPNTCRKLGQRQSRAQGRLTTGECHENNTAATRATQCACGKLNYRKLCPANSGPVVTRARAGATAMRACLNTCGNVCSQALGSARLAASQEVAPALAPWPAAAWWEECMRGGPLGAPRPLPESCGLVVRCSAPVAILPPSLSNGPDRGSSLARVRAPVSVSLRLRSQTGSGCSPCCWSSTVKRWAGFGVSKCRHSAPCGAVATTVKPWQQPGKIKLARACAHAQCPAMSKNKCRVCARRRKANRERMAWLREKRLTRPRRSWKVRTRLPLSKAAVKGSVKT